MNYHRMLDPISNIHRLRSRKIMVTGEDLSLGSLPPVFLSARRTATMHTFLALWVSQPPVPWRSAVREYTFEKRPLGERGCLLREA